MGILGAILGTLIALFGAIEVFESFGAATAAADVAAGAAVKRAAKKASKRVFALSEGAITTETGFYARVEQLSRYSISELLEYSTENAQKRALLFMAARKKREQLFEGETKKSLKKDWVKAWSEYKTCLQKNGRTACSEKRELVVTAKKRFLEYANLRALENKTVKLDALIKLNKERGGQDTRIYDQLVEAANDLKRFKKIAVAKIKKLEGE